jgi:hypothetical protein
MITICVVPALESKMPILQKTYCFAVCLLLDSLYIIPMLVL